MVLRASPPGETVSRAVIPMRERPDKERGGPLAKGRPKVSPPDLTTNSIPGGGVVVLLDRERERRRGGAWCPPSARMWTWTEAERSLSRWPA
jgi:hypothetical protein